MSLNFRITGLEELQRDLKEAARAALASSFCSMELKHFATYCIVYARIAFLITKWRTCKMKNFSRETRLVSRPNGAATHSNFEIAEVELSPLGSGEIRVRNTWMSVDPYMRGRMRDYESYLPPFQIGKVLEGTAVGEVVESNDPGFATGDTVMSMMGWREVFNAPAAALQKPEVEVSSPQMYLGVCGHTGQTAYIGLADVIKLQPGEVIFISGGAGAVGSIACQIAKLMGATVIASAGGVEKCAYLKQLGVEKVIDYKKTENLLQALAEIAPNGIDAYFDIDSRDLLSIMDGARHLLLGEKSDEPAKEWALSRKRKPEDHARRG